jgi:hypothetical protein
VTDTITRRRETLVFLGAECLHQEIDQPRRAIHHQVWRDRMIAIGPSLDCHCSAPFLVDMLTLRPLPWSWQRTSS